MTPIGIWRSVKATLKAVTAPDADVVASEVDDDERDLRHAPGRRPAAPSARAPRRARVVRVDARLVAEAEPRSSGRIWTRRWPSDPTTTPTASAVDARTSGARSDAPRR